MLPDFLIIGAMKSGTTSLYRYLLSHPDISRPTTKEPEFFSKNYIKGFDWYKSLFSGKGYNFEASTGYTKRQRWPDVAERIFHDLPTVKLIYSVRDPVERAVSHYQHNVRKGREKLPFSRAIRKPGSHYIATSRYAFQLEAYYQFYQAGRVHVIDFEELKSDPVSCMNDLCEFIGVAPRYDKNTLDTVYNRADTNALEVSKEDLDYLKAQLRTDVESLRAMTAIGFRKWCL